MTDTTRMTELSPAAQAVLDAFLKTPGEEPMPGWNYGRDIAAALRAAADQVVPEDGKECECFTNEAIRLNRMGVRFALLTIAAELEAQ
jgi:hypothetical protein